MEKVGLLPSVSIPVIFLGTLVLIGIAVEAGFRWARRTHKPSEEPHEPQIGGMVGSLLGLLAFLLAVTFGIATETFLTRKRALTEEAIAVRIAYLRAAFIAEPHRSEVRAILREYVGERLYFTKIDLSYRGRPVNQVLDALWAKTEVIAAENPSSETVAQFLEASSDVIAQHHNRMNIRQKTRIPGAFWASLYFIAVLSLVAMGYECGATGAVRSPVMLIVAVAFAAIIALILDLDRPGEGFVNVSQSPMVELRDAMK